MGLPVLAAVALMAPRILQAEFGLFDDANSISVAQQTWSGEWDWRQDVGQFGRFRPVYWLGFSMLYPLARLQPAGYFIGNFLLLSLTVLLLSLSLLRLTGNPLAAGVGGLAFVLGGPAVEAAYTLSKSELLQTFLMVGAGAGIVLVPHAPKRIVRFAGGALAAVLVLLAALTKETTGVLLIISPVWLAMAWLVNRGPRGNRRNTAMALDFMLACVLGIGLAIALTLASSASIASAAGPRANFGLAWPSIAAKANIWIDLIVRDWLYLVPWVIAAALGLTAARRPGWAPVMLGAVVWMAVWFGLYLPYRFTPEYYLLPFSLGASVIAGLLVLQVSEILPRQGRVMSFLMWGGMAVGAILFLLTIPNNLSNGAIQIAVDRANADMLRFVAQEAPSGARVFVNLRTDSEYVVHMGPVLGMVHGRADLQVQPYPADGTFLSDDGRKTLIVSPFMENIPYPVVRLGVPEAESRSWEEALQQELAGQLRLQGETRRNVRLFIVDAPRLVCLAWREMDYCQRRNAPFDTRRFSAGWKIYALDGS